MKINIAYAPDDKYVNQTVVSMISAIENNKDNELEFVIMYSHLTDESIKKLNSVDGAKIRMLKMDEADFLDLTLSHWVTIQAWFRIKLSDMCPDLDRILYLDCDTLVLGDLKELFTLDLSGKYLAGVKDVWGVNRYVERLGLESRVYVNSGVLLFNCDYCRKEHFYDKIVEFAKNNAKIIEFCDQDSINKVVDTKKIVLSPKYNFMDTWWRGGYYEYSGEEEQAYLDAKENPVIVHLTGPKPEFKGCGNKFKNVWWNYAKLASCYDEIFKKFEDSKAPKEKIGDILFSIKNEYKGKTKTKILRLLGAKIKLSKAMTPDDIERKRRKREHKKLSKQRFDIPAFYASDYDKNSGMDLITVSFNNPKVIKYQINLIRKFAKGNYTIIICDNSNVREKAEAIKKVCEDLNVTFVRVNPKKNPNGYSDSHGLALNWIYENVVKKRENNFAFLDHDIFPVKNINIEDYVKEQDFYGHKNRSHKDTLLNKGMWYIWPGLSFFKYDVLKNKNANFGKWRRFGFLKIKVVGADTGSANWPVLYSKYDTDKLKFANTSFWNIRKNCAVKDDEIRALAQTDLIQYFDNENWLHMIDGSEWQDSKGKTEMVYEMLDRLVAGK